MIPPSPRAGASLGGSFMKNMMDKIPYRDTGSAPDFSEKNPRYDTFKQNAEIRQTALKRRSVSSDTLVQKDNTALATILSTKLQSFLYQSINEQKVARLKDYAVMAGYEVIQDAFDEIANEFFNPDDKGRVAEVLIDGKEDKPEIQTVIEKEFKRYIGHFKFEDNGIRYVKQLLSAGEVFFENVIEPEYPEYGVLGVIPLSPELMEPIYLNIISEDIEAFALKKPIYDLENPALITGYEVIPYPTSQVVYIHSDDWNPEKTYRVPLLESARRPFRQLAMIEDSIVIYRLVHAPERLIFNVDVGNMPAPKAEEYLNRMAQDYWSRRSIDPNSNDVTQNFNPQSMLDAFWFPKRAGSQGSSVEKLSGGQNLGELQDLQYFANKLYKSLRVPISRLQSDNTYRDGTDILREELKFATFIIKLQIQFARAIRSGFLTHLKLSELMGKYDISEDDIRVKFFPPTNFYEMREAKRFEIRVNNFNTLTAGDSVSKTYAQRRWLKWTDDEIKTNRELLRKDKELSWELGQIEQGGPNWAANQAAAVQGLINADTVGAQGGGDGGDIPPSFSGGPVDTGAGNSAETNPIGGQEAAPGAPTGASTGAASGQGIRQEDGSVEAGDNLQEPTNNGI